MSDLTTQVQAHRKSELEMVFNDKHTENGDDSNISTGNHLVDLLFRGEYYTKHLREVTIGNSEVEKLFAMFVRDPRHGLKYRDYGRVLMRQAGVSAENVALAGRLDDLWENPVSGELNMEWVKFLFDQCKDGNELAKKWMPHYQAKEDGKPTKSTIMAAKFRRMLGMNKQAYGKFVKCNTVESKLSSHRNDDIDFSKLPSLALIKYWARFAGTSKTNPKTDMAERFQAYLDSVKKGESKMNMSTASVYDIYRNADKINADIAFAQIEKISGSWLPIVDTSGSMFWKESNDAISKALAVAHYLAKCSTYAPNKVVSFSSCPKLIELGVTLPPFDTTCKLPKENGTVYNREIRSMYTGDCSNTDFGAVMKCLSKLTTDFPDYLVVLTDGEFDEGSNSANRHTLMMWRRNGIKTKMVWWNFNPRNTTSPEVIRQGEDGSIFISGYNPQILKFLNCGFDAEIFLATLLSEYKKAIGQD